MLNNVRSYESIEQWQCRLREEYGQNSCKEIHNEGIGAVAVDTTCYNMAMNSWGKAAKADRTEALFWEMFKSYSETGDAGIAPDDISVSTVLAAWAKSEHEDAVLRAEMFFERIQKLMGK